MGKLLTMFFLTGSGRGIRITLMRFSFWAHFGQRFFERKLLISLAGGRGFEPR